ncbi:uncharacterized protein LOC126909752 [Daktulosphaira vitifoliae]|uniref:uncharacterized protein LOC126909752 n=1 Tax=Daktulosphaira vitifoliae TaxID=58002 RepID=UPI0021A98353|nr:uncharacterized protein LOC126909752 [Daktulosphaira vitifoliae]
MQFGHEEVYKILVESYGADPNVRDWSGRKPRQYQTNKDTSLSADTYRSEYTCEKTKFLFNSLPRPKRRNKTINVLSSLSFSHVTNSSKCMKEKHFKSRQQPSLYHHYAIKRI